MRRLNYYLLYIALFLSALSVSVVATFVWNDQYWSHGTGSFGVCVDAGEGLTGLGGFSGYVFYDGMKLSSARSRFESKEAAERCFHSQLEAASSILERETSFDEARENVVGERVVAIFRADEYSQTAWAGVVSVDGNTIFEVMSPSLTRSLNFEKKSRRY